MEIFEYDFILRGIVAGLIIGVVVPLIGIFLVLKRYSLIADTLAHVSLAGVALGLFFGLNPIVTALGSSVVASVAIEKLRNTKKIYGESALALFLSGSLALAVVILSLARGFNANLFSYLFGSIVTVGIKDVYLILILAVITAVVLFIFFKELLYTTFDEDSAKVSGIQTEKINIILIVLTSLAVSLAIPIVGVLLISALIVIPVITALQLKKDFFRTILWAEFFSLFSIMSGIVGAFYLNLSTSGTIVLVMLAIFMLVFLFKKYMSHTS
ncbi:MAG: ABC-3 protein [Candidatus Moranbacteria bacterium GW2011_GWE1_35_17]|nr:MAG: ABC-3 protein [Candidatus Moranbacteria bacterium GW2011_GWE1_35_17]KKP73224.1 MAG: ABC-3 protein [Candidatus Moranbacteria bacterium GW2011_GWE2_35_164]KKP84650.1 MAG: ABC-3 protein [Candidatus Moranbacteria bacterium GW2011_GWF1_35_5]